jgi:hypothetical protein
MKKDNNKDKILNPVKISYLFEKFWNVVATNRKGIQENSR